MKKRYEVWNKDSGNLVGTFTVTAIKKIGFKKDNYLIKEVVVKTEADRVREEGRS